jgi:hypothetical protein
MPQIKKNQAIKTCKGHKVFSGFHKALFFDEEHSPGT